MDKIRGTDPPKSLTDRFWTRDSSVLLGIFTVTALLVVYFWWPLARAMLWRVDWNGAWWLDLDWLLIGIFTFMSATIVARANLKTDALIIFTAVCGGLAIEAWGTQTNLWHYYTSERPPLWIIPAWPIATLSIDRITRTLDFAFKKWASEHPHKTFFKALYWIIFVFFMGLMAFFIAPTFDKPFTVLSFLLCLTIMFTPTDHRRTVLIFIAGMILGYFLELWGTTRHCWTYYTRETPPLFAVMAHGLAAVAFWRAGLVLKTIGTIIRKKLPIVSTGKTKYP
jgi:hypothetical protein